MQTAGAAQLIGGQSQPAPQPIRHLERISNDADRIARLASMVQGFLDRFYGAGPDCAANEAAVQIGYRNDLDRLSANIDQLDTRVQSLVELG